MFCVRCPFRLLLLRVSLSDCSHKSGALLGDVFVSHFEGVHFVLEKVGGVLRFGGFIFGFVVIVVTRVGEGCG